MFGLIFIALCAAFALEEFVLIKPVSTIARSDPLSRRIELLAIWVPAIGLGLTGATMRAFGGERLAGVANALGVVLCGSGIVLRYWSRKTLGRFFTIGVVHQEGHEVVRTGPYRWIRHPGYLGFVLFYVGVPLVIGSWLGALLLSAPALIIFVWLIVVEDRRLSEALGEAYVAYMAQSARLIPGVW
jgi:protein-S-isoprenylcysteine O-methyltransferase Ste14